MSDMKDLIERLEKATEGSACIEWPRKRDRGGRGRIWHGGKLKLAHRWAWETVRGPIPPGKLLCHTCDNAGCVNPAHLYIGTHADNMRDMKDRRRYFAARDPVGCQEAARKAGLLNDWSAGEMNPKAKITAADAEDIAASAEVTKALAARYGVNRTTIQRIRRGTAWSALNARSEA